MKEPTTPYCISINDKRQIDRGFLLSEGWVLTEEYPLFEVFTHSKNEDLKCSIGLYGGFSITELHWLNKDPETEFSAMNPNLTKEDYHTIIRLLNIKTIK